MAGAAPHTPFLAFFFLTCAVGRLQDGRDGSAHAISWFFLFDVCAPLQHHCSAHAISCFFLFGVYGRATSRWQGRLRTRYFLLFPFWRVHAPSAPTAPRTSFPVFTPLFLFVHSYSHFFFFISTIVNIRDNMCTNKNERRRFYVY